MWYGSLSLLLLLTSTASHKGSPHQGMLRNVQQKATWKSAHWLRENISVGISNKELCQVFLHICTWIRWNVQAFVSEWDASYWAWVFFLYSMRNKNLRGFFYVSQMVSHPVHPFSTVLISTSVQQKYGAKLGRGAGMITLQLRNLSANVQYLYCNNMN